jgi:hypothetical protein
MADIDLNGGHVAVAFGVVAAGLFVFHAAKTAGVPLPAAPVTEALVHIPDQLAIPYLIRPDMNRDTPRYTQHRYPDRVGGEFTTAIHYGHSRLAVPSTKDSNWITCPPSEVTI